MADGPWTQYQQSATPAAGPWIQYAKSAAPAAEASAPSHLARFGAELMQPVIGLGQLASRIPLRGVNPLQPAEVDTLARENQSTIDRARQAEGSTGFNWEQLGADVANPINYLGGELASALGIGKGLAGPVSGALSGLTQPVTGGNFWKQKAGQAALGGVAGGASDLAVRGVSKIVSPELSKAAQILSGLGVRLTPGQMAGGGLKAFEDKFTSFPLFGGLVRDAQTTAIHDLNRAAINEGLKPIGVKLPSNVPVGRDALNFMKDSISAAYDRVMPFINGKMDSDLADDLKHIEIRYGPRLSPALRQELMDVIQHEVRDKFSPFGDISGLDAQAVGTTLDNIYNKARQSEDTYRNRMAGAIKEIDKAFDDMLDRQNPAATKAKHQVDLAHAHYKTVEEATGRTGATSGIFTPAHLASAVRSRDKTKDKSGYARGFALMQKMSDAAKEVMPSSVPDSGTAGRVGLGALLAGGAHLNLAAAAPFAVPAALYTKPGMSVVRKLAAPSNTRKAVRRALDAVAPRTAPAAAQAALGVAPPLMPGEFGGPQ
jgi:hypothetical protein